MSLQYLSDDSGHRTAVLISIDEWNRMRETYPIEGELRQWQKDIIDERLKEIEDNPEGLGPIEELFEELDKEE